MRNLPFKSFAANQIWLALVALALDLTAWMQMLALTDHDARRWEPKTLRLHLFSLPGRIARHAQKPGYTYPDQPRPPACSAPR